MGRKKIEHKKYSLYLEIETAERFDEMCKNLHRGPSNMMSWLVNLVYAQGQEQNEQAVKPEVQDV